MFAARRLRILPVLVSLLTANCVVGCHKDKADAGKADGAQGKVDAAALKKSLAELGPKLEAQNAAYKDLRTHFDPLPQDLPGFGEIRGKFYSVEESRGLMGSKLTWLGERLDAAVKSGNSAELEKLSKDIAKTHDEMKEFDNLGVELRHQVLPFERIAEREAKEAEMQASTFVRILPTNYEVRGSQDGVEQRLLEVVEDSKVKLDKNAWFDFDHLHFAGPAADIDKDLSKRQLQNVFEILKAYPKVKLRIGGFTDNSGDAAEAKKFSGARAEAVKNELVRLGVDASRLESKGYGPENPVCIANDGERCRSRNRRIAVQVTAR